MLFSLFLAGEQNKAGSNWLSWVLIGVVVVFMIGGMIFMNRKSKKNQQEAEALINAVKPGNKVKTIGGVCGIVVEVDPEENTFVLETGSEATGKCYMKFDRQAILQSDAVVDNKPKAEESVEAPEAVSEEAPASEEKSETPDKDGDKSEN